ncbi:MAG: hypothetical protein ACSLE9_00770 [Burkholderiaceae bacterium]
MGMTLRELQQRMSSEEFSLHIALAMHDAKASAGQARSAEPPTADELEWFGGAT